jgi:hypothetical protein
MSDADRDVGIPDKSDERLPRELDLPGDRYRSVGRRELAGCAWLPALFVLLSVAIWVSQRTGITAPWGVGVALVGLLFVALWVWANRGFRGGGR